MRTVAPLHRNRIDVSFSPTALRFGQISAISIKKIVFALLAMAVVIESSESVHMILTSAAKYGARALNPSDDVVSSRAVMLSQTSRPSRDHLQTVFSHQIYVEYDDEIVEVSKAPLAKELRLTTSDKKRLRGHRDHRYQ